MPPGFTLCEYYCNNNMLYIRKSHLNLYHTQGRERGAPYKRQRGQSRSLHERCRQLQPCIPLYPDGGAKCWTQSGSTGGGPLTPRIPTCFPVSPKDFHRGRYSATSLISIHLFNSAVLVTYLVHRPVVARGTGAPAGLAASPAASPQSGPTTIAKSHCAPTCLRRRAFFLSSRDHFNSCLHLDLVSTPVVVVGPVVFANDVVVTSSARCVARRILGCLRP